MSATNGNIPDLTIESISRAFYKEAAGYGFGQVDYVKFVNRILDMAMQSNSGSRKPPHEVGDSALTPGLSAQPSTGDLPLHGQQVSVRRFDPDRDLALFDRWLADASGRYFLLSRTTSERRDIREVVGNDSSVVGIVMLPDSTPIGSVSYLDLDPVQHKAELRKLIGDPAQRRKGLAKEASLLWIRYGLEVLGLKKIYLNTLNTDIRNIKLNEELGFAVEGVLRNEVLIDGNYRDVLRMGLWRE